MKKLCFVFGALVAVSGAASAANVINGNPFYSPAKGRFYNILTPIKLDTKFEQFYMSDEFGYGITDNLSVMIATTGSYDSSDNPQFGKWAWNNLELGMDWSVSNNPDSMADIYASVKQIYDTRQHLETVAYNWTLGTRVGRMESDWTVAGVVELDYLNGHCWRRTERCDTVLCEERQYVCCVETFEVIHEYGSFTKPLSVKFSPQSFSPTCI